jgi:hypothetical protein
MSDNGTPFKNKQVDKLCSKFKIIHNYSTAYNPIQPLMDKQRPSIKPSANY